MTRANDLSNFDFQFSGAGHYMVTYTSQNRGDYWRAVITDMTLIDATKNAEWAKVRDIERLRAAVIRNGAHFNKYNHRIS